MSAPSLIFSERQDENILKNDLEAIQKSPAAVLSEISLDDVMNATIESIRFSVKPWFPRRHVTLLGGHGGIGKSSLALAIAAHVACGQPFAGLDVEHSTVLIVSLEDEPNIVRSRLRKIIEIYNLPHQRVLDHMRLLDGTQTFSALMTESESYSPQPLFTKAFVELAEASEGAGLIIIDNASDAFDANENSRRTVRAFVRGLAGLARKNNCALVLLAHIDKASAKNGSQGNSYSGSTAWHNSARSRLALLEQDGIITLVHEKANLSSLANPLIISFKDGAPIAVTNALSAGLTSEDFDQAEVARAIRAANEAGIIVPAAMSGPCTAIHVLETLKEYCPEFKRGKIGKQRAKAAIVALIRNGLINRVTYTTAQRNQREKLVFSNEAPNFSETDVSVDINQGAL